jgi:hypothetical protein
MKSLARQYQVTLEEGKMYFIRGVMDGGHCIPTLASTEDGAPLGTFVPPQPLQQSKPTP